MRPTPAAFAQTRPTHSPMALRIATRGSALARWQAEHVRDLLLANVAGDDLDVELVIVSTQGDRDKSTPLGILGGKGVFVKEVQAAVLDGRADIAVHSGKDLPGLTPAELVIGSVPPRADPRDALIGSALSDLPEGGVVATGSIRRKAQLAAQRPDLRFAELRGNIDTRLAKAADFDAIVMAAAALDRLSLTPEPVDRLAVDVMVPQVAQGALAIECREDDSTTRLALAAIEDVQARRVFDTERAFLSELGGDCDLPVGAHAVLEGDTIHLTAIVANNDGSTVLRETRSDEQPVALGRSVARYLLDDAGGSSLLDRS